MTLIDDEWTETKEPKKPADPPKEPTPEEKAAARKKESDDRWASRETGLLDKVNTALDEKLDKFAERFEREDNDE